MVRSMAVSQRQRLQGRLRPGENVANRYVKYCLPKRFNPTPPVSCAPFEIPFSAVITPRRVHSVAFVLILTEIHPGSGSHVFFTKKPIPKCSFGPKSLLKSLDSKVLFSYACSRCCNDFPPETAHALTLRSALKIEKASDGLRLHLLLVDLRFLNGLSFLLRSHADLINTKIIRFPFNPQLVPFRPDVITFFHRDACAPR